MRKVMTVALAATLAACGAEPASETVTEANASAVVDPAGEDAPADADAPAAPPSDDMPPAPDEPARDPTAPPSPEPTASPEAPEDETATGTAIIPAAVRGRWGLVPADCTSTRGDAKGLIRVARDTIRFYESRATLGRVIERGRSRIVADFAFEGEGQTWSRRMVLDAQDGGRTLIRREQGADAMPGPLRYTRCPA